MIDTTNRVAEVILLRRKLLELGVCASSHAVLLDALLSTFCSVAEHHSCCTEAAAAAALAVADRLTLAATIPATSH